MVALGRVAIHTGDERQRRKTTALARRMLADGTPANRAHGGRLLALGAMADGKPADARAVLDAAGPGSGGRITPLYPMDVTDDPQLVRIALAAGDSRLAADTVAAAEDRARPNPGISSVRAAAAQARGLLDADVALLAEACHRADGDHPARVRRLPDRLTRCAEQGGNEERT
ncbi:hypothetical protein GCM10017788_61060 [Amycolatopsis acidiphila]|nr:hypothetical protein GCM10017788_61060 [Amycolatopsis acidiphila]